MINKILYEIDREVRQISYEIKRKVRKIIHFIKGKILLNFHKYLVHPIATRTLQRRCNQAKRGDACGLWNRFVRMQTYISLKEKKEFYRKHMEAIVHMSEDYNVPQYVLIARYDPDKILLRYKAKNGKIYGNDPNS
jgi:hypothetical protein